MKVKLDGVRRIAIYGEYIRLDTLLKLANITSTGGEAKLRIQNGEVFVDGAPCTMRGKKIRPDNIVRFGRETLLVKTTTT